MATRFITGVAVTLVLMAGFASPARAADENVRYFMFIGEPNAAAWQFMMENPQDRKEAVAAGMEKVGGKILSYWFGLGDGKNYIITQLPDDNEVIQAVYVMRLPSGLLSSYEIIELMPSDQMSAALKRSAEFLEMEKQAGGGVPDQ